MGSAFALINKEKAPPPRKVICRMLATMEYFGKDRLDEIKAEDALLPRSWRERVVGRRVFVPVDILETMVVSNPEPRICSEGDCHSLLSLLSVAERKVISQYFLEGFSWEEIAEREKLGMPMVRMLAVRGVGKIRRHVRASLKF